MYDLSFDQLSIAKSGVVIIPKKAKDIAEAIEVHEILVFLIQHIFPDKKIYIMPPRDDYYSIYNKWFPQCTILDKYIKNDIFYHFISENGITTLDFTDSNEKNRQYLGLIPLTMEQMSVGYLNLLCLACMLISSLEYDGDLVYLGKNDIFFKTFCNSYLSKQINVIHGIERLHEDCRKIIVLDDYVSDTDIIKTLEYIQTNPHSSIVIFLNNERRNLFYHTFLTELIEHIIPFSIKNKKERNGLKMTENENILYVYATNKEIQNKLLTAKIEKSLDGVEPHSKKLELENLYLRGMLDATELKVNHLLKVVKDLGQDPFNY